jgi:lambda family phage portal protein
MQTAIQLDEVTLGPVRVIAQRRAPAAPRRLETWNQIAQLATRPPRVLKSFKASGEYKSGNVERTTARWNSSQADANRALRYSLTTMRARSRTLERDDPYAKKFLGLCETNIIGPDGITVQSRVEEIAPDGRVISDTAANRIIEREYFKFSQAGNYDATHLLSRASFERLFIRTVARDGEVLVKKIDDKKSRWGRRYQLLEADWLDETYNEDRADGTRIIMGVELAPSGQAIAYHLHTRHPGDIAGSKRGERVRYSADQIKLHFLPTRAGQVRGIPWMHAAMSRLYQLGEFDESALIAARIGADKAMLLEDPEGMVADSVADGALPGDNGDETGPLYFNSQKGSIDILPRGAKIAQFDPNYPSDAYGPFVLAALRGVSTGFGVEYHSLTGDLSQVNFSSIRAGTLQEHDMWKILQGWAIESLSQDLYADWLMMALLSPFKPLSYLPAGKYDKFNSPTFQARRWEWVDPKKDLDAKILAIGARLTSHRRVMAEQGIDLEDLLAEIQADKALAASYGIDLDQLTPPTQQPAAQPEPQDEVV